MMLSMETVEMKEAKQRIQRASNMFTEAHDELDVDIAIAENKLAELRLCKLLKEMKETEAKK